MEKMELTRYEGLINTKGTTISPKQQHIQQDNDTSFVPNSQDL